jgi:undecaprenyl phosphate N,N'-diacetylbacillosamine 1-phosphate transferase
MYKYYFKPLIDYIISIILLLMLCPLIFILAILIKIDSKGPVFFTQERLGKDGKIFNIIKFRTMFDRKMRSGGQVFMDHPEITRLGKFLRRSKLDEIPQLINILKGDMSIIGPRPSLPDLQERFDENGIFRIKVKPGLSNYAAINGSIYLSWPERWVYDRYYVEHLSLFLDVKIVIMTCIVVIFGDKVFLKK